MSVRGASRSRAVATRVETRPQPPPSRGPDPPRQRGRPRWVFPASFVISALLHLIALVMLRFESEPVRVFAPGDSVVLGPPVGMVVYDIEPVEEPARSTPEVEQRAAPTPPKPEPVLPLPIPPPQPEPALPMTAELPPCCVRVPGLPGSVAERFNPRMGDPHLWKNSRLIGEASVHPDDAVRRRITIEEWNAVVNPRLSIEEYNDSVRLAEEAAAKAVDWTAKPGGGGRWGVSPRGIHLGSFTLPIPIHFATPMGRRAGARAAQRSWSEIRAQRGATEIQEDIKDRIKAIRERKEAERRDLTRRRRG